MINLVVFIEQTMRFIGFRPTFRVPRFVPLFGAIACLWIMVLIDALFTIVALITVILLYVILTKRKLRLSQRDIRAGLFQFLAERATSIAARLPRNQVSWKPDLLLPVEDPTDYKGRVQFVGDLVSPSGSIYAFSARATPTSEEQQALDDIFAPLSARRLLVSTSVIEDGDFMHGCRLVMQTLLRSPFRPNTLFLTMGVDPSKDEGIKNLVRSAYQYELGTMILRADNDKQFGERQTINLWLRDRSTNWHLAILAALQLQLNWEGRINVITVADQQDDVKYLDAFLQRLFDLARMPSRSETHILVGKFYEVLQAAPRGDINIFGVGGGELPFDFIRGSVDQVGSACLFVKGSGHESALV